ncbi:thioesterase family protein [Streptomyces sp. NPDC091266]|uniref:thioesterase family protein n=1 Tax=Streptomyces sp. NPDC091266 TaxID=3365978 RepID=UPI0038289150
MTAEERRATAGLRESFYERLDKAKFASNSSTAGPWGPQMQHAGPPSALLTMQMMNDHPREGFHPARVTFELLGQIPVAELTAETSVLYSTKRTDLLSGTLLCGDKPVAMARMWRYRSAPESLASVRKLGIRHRPLPFEDSVAPVEPLVLAYDDSVTPPVPLDMTNHTAGYMSAVEWRFASEKPFGRYGPGQVWARPRIPLVLDETDSPFGRLMTMADSCWSMGRRVEMPKHVAINTEITVHCHRLPEGDWLRLDGSTVTTPGGAGVSHSTMSDREDECAYVLQSMFIA